MTIFNPLDHVVSNDSKASSDLESSSKVLENDTHGVCPKCGQAMGVSKTSKEEVYYCSPCRVSSPMPKEKN